MIFLQSVIFVAMACLYMYPGVAGLELQSYNYPQYYIGLLNTREGYIVRQSNPWDWNIVPGLCGEPGTVSIQLSGSTSRFLRHSGFLLYADNIDGTALFAKDACFYIHKDKWFPGHDAFESVNYPGRYIRHQGYRLKVHPYISTTLFEADASFRSLNPVCNLFQSRNYPLHYFGLNGDQAYIKTTPSAWVLVRPGLAGHNGSVSFRACDDSTKYLRHRNYWIHQDSYEGSQLYKLDATFTKRERFFSGAAAYESTNYPNHFIRHTGYRLRIDPYNAAPIYKLDASFYTH